ncbi:MAG TPA: UbiX family flavin prenyltransferase [Bacteroidales bacterium]|nr:UbiX family flavin prenyltransferase [Bacteroidales bacterium]
MNSKLIIAVTGASGSLYADKMLSEIIQYSNYEVALIFSETGKKVWEYELKKNVPVETDRIKIFDNQNYFAPSASGSANYNYMVIVPCSMGTLGRIAHGTSNDLISRSADVMLKERKKIILVPRELPYNLIHLKNMTTLTEAGAMIVPASPSFYSHPKSIEQLVQTVTDRILKYIDISKDSYEWGK